MSLESKSANQLNDWNNKANQVMTSEIKSSLTNHAIVGAIIWIIPLWGIETTFYVVVLWHMYYSLAHLAGRKFNFSAIMGGFIINVMICLVANLVMGFLDLIFGLGLILGGICGYLATYQSGKSYIGCLMDMTKAKERL